MFSVQRSAKGLVSIWSMPGLPFSLLLGCRNRVRCVPQNMAVWQAGHCTKPNGWGRLCALPKSHQGGPFASQSTLWASLTFLCPFLSHLLHFRRHRYIPPSFHPSLGMCVRVVWTRPHLSGFIFPSDANQRLWTPQSMVTALCQQLH